MSNKVSLQEDTFCVHYTTIGAETYSNALKSAKAAEYSEASAHTQGSRLLKKQAIMERISELHKQNMARNFLSIDKVLSDLENTRIKADNKGDLASSIRCSELQGKYKLMFSERIQIGRDNPEQMQKLTEAQEQTASRFAEWSILEDLRIARENQNQIEGTNNE